jgi:acylphosphatase
MKSVRVCISGRVQGVWFRAWTEQQAVAMGLDGWVRNRRDGAVEALFAGDDGKVDHMITLCHEGPPAANVTEVRVVADESIHPPGFKVRSTE